MLHRIVSRSVGVFAAAALGLGLAACEDNTAGTPLTPPPASTAVYVNVDTTTPPPTTGTTGQRVTPAAVFKVTYPDGSPAVGQVVTFSLNLGGHIAQLKDTVDAGGFVSPGKWTLGARTATQRLIASPVAGNAGFIDVVAEAGPPGAGPGTGQPGGHGPAPVVLGAAGNYVILAQSAISNVPTSAITGNVGLSPAAASFITGFALSLDAGGAFSTDAAQVTGNIYASDYAVPTPANLTTAISNMQTAYVDAAGRPTPDFTELESGDIGSLILVPGLYKWSNTVTIPTDVTLLGGPDDVWIFQIAGGITQASATRVILAGGARAQNVFWQTFGVVDIGTTAHMEGVVLSQTSITLKTGASANGSLLAQTAVTLDGNTVVAQ